MKTIELGDHEALVLFDLLHREIDANKERRLAPLFAHPAEFWSLNMVLLRLESLLAEPFGRDYAAHVDAVRAKIMDECDPEGTYVVGASE
jgi:hypothetical protein